MEAATPILIVEDELLIRMAAVEMIEDAGYDAVGVSDAETAEHFLRERTDIRLLFTDIDLPGRDGIALAKRIYAARPDIEIVVTSGKHRMSDDALPDHGSFLPKPYTQEQLLRVLAGKLG
ncbi:response regulator [Altererythrobacter sp. SALINAS58]|uniref:response regulator n=1 Tax=Alteripontixanthobacter muriae TaxID=2705546 RepID=UPI0015775890|nr:response regulator [Alteripontixanthobacter muriae]NTZ44000.1 response regulator [Alteripontixanthobacter muriae]